MERRFITNVNDYSYTVGTFNPDSKWFYDYETYDLHGLDVKVGQEVKDGNIVSEPNEKIVEIIDKYTEYRRELKKRYEKYGRCTLDFAHTPRFYNLLQRFKNRKKRTINGVDDYILSIISRFGDYMDIKVRIRHQSDYDSQVGFEYPEDVIEVIGAMYKILYERIIKNGETLNFVMCGNGTKNEEFENFRREIEMRTHFNRNNFKSEYEYLAEQWYNTPNGRYFGRKKMTAVLSPNSSQFTVESTNINLLEVTKTASTATIYRENPQYIWVNTKK